MPTPKRQPAFQFYPGTWFASIQVTTMSAEVEGTYIRLLGHQWLSEKLPADPKELRLLTKLTPAQWAKAWLKLEPLFVLTADRSGRVNPTLEAVREERAAFIYQQKIKGAAGGKAKAERSKERSRTDGDDVAAEEATGKPIASSGYPPEVAGQVAAEQPNGSSVSVSVSVSGTEYPSPSPDGEGSSHAAPPPMAVVAHAPETSEAVLEGESLTQYRQRMRASAPSLDSQIALIPHDEGRRAVGRFLDEQRILPDRIVNWVRRIEGWTNGLGASGGRPVTWEAVVQGIDEMLDTNPPGQSISPAQLLTFVERAERTRKAPEVQYGTRAGVAPKANTASSAEIEQHALVAFARDGDSEAIAECERRGIDYVRAIA